MGLGESIKTCFARKYTTFRGRAPRSEYWYFCLFVFILLFALQFIGGVAGVLLQAVQNSDPDSHIGTLFKLLWSIFMVLVYIAVAVPNISVTVRRLHDRDRSGWWYWFGLVPIVGGIWLLVWFCRPGTAGPNRFGEDPLAGAPAMPGVAA